MDSVQIFMLLLVLLLAYIYLGYPVLLCLLSRAFPRPHRFDPSHEPTVTLIISAYNEVEVIESKILNSFALDYPREKLAVMVVSDCSSDGTDEVALSYRDRGVTLVRAPERRGKTAALNLALERVQSEVVVFSDANALYEPAAVRNLVRHFSDPEVGYAVGCARYQEEEQTAAGESEGAYWDLEVKLKQWESDFSSVVGGDGAIYAIRRPLYEPMQVTDINDFVNPLQIVVKGHRGIFEPEAVCTEEPAGQFDKEFSRKVRISNRSFNALLRVPGSINPFRVGRFAWQMVSHKLLRWFSPYFLLLFLALDAAALVRAPGELAPRLLAAASGTILCLASVGWLASKRGTTQPLFYIPYYFVLMNLASAIGIFIRLKGRTISTWTTVREESAPVSVPLPVLPRAILFALILFLLGLGSGWLKSLDLLAASAYLMLGFLGHAYFGYPRLVGAVAHLARRRIQSDEGYLPEVTLLVVAYNEAEVIDEKLRNSLLLDYPRELLRIVVASDGSTDATDRIVASYGARGVELLAFARNRGKISALNDAMRELSSPIVILSDANVIYDRLAIRKLVRNFADPRVGVVSGKVTLLNEGVSYAIPEESYYGIEHRIQDHEGALGTLVGADGAMYAIRRDLFVPPPPDTILDDLVIPLQVARRGYLVLHEKEALAFEPNHTELSGEFLRKVRIIAGGYQCLLRPSLLPRLSQPLLLFCFFSHKVLRWVSGFLVLSLFGVLWQFQAVAGAGEHLFFDLLLAAVASLIVLALLVQLFPVLKSFRLSNYSHYFFMLMLASLVGCYLGLTGRQKVTWRGAAN